MTRRSFRRCSSVVSLALAAFLSGSDSTFGAFVTVTLDDVLGSSFIIGNARFTVQASYSNGNSNNQNPPLSPTSIAFSIDSADANHPGFTLTGDFASKPIDPAAISAQALVFFYTVSPLPGYRMLGMDSSIGGASVSGSAHASAETFYCLTPFISLDPKQSAIVAPTVSDGGSSNPESVAFGRAFRKGSRSGETSFGTFAGGGEASFNAVSVHYTTEAVPEPGSLLLFASSLPGLIAFLRFRRHESFRTGAVRRAAHL